MIINVWLHLKKHNKELMLNHKVLVFHEKEIDRFINFIIAKEGKNEFNINDIKKKEIRKENPNEENFLCDMYIPINDTYIFKPLD